MRESNLASKYIIAFLISICILVLSVNVALGNPAQRLKVLISFNAPPVIADELFIRSLGGQVRYRYHFVNVIAATLPEHAVYRLQNLPKISRVELDLPIHAVDIELDNSWGVKHIGAGEVHEYEFGNRGEGVNIAIIDSGIDASHPDLDGNYKGGFNFINPGQLPADVYGHGTHVAGIACAEDNDNGLLEGPFGVIGVAPMCNLYAVKVLEDNGWGDSSDLIAALEWAVENDMDIANLSLGWDRYPGEAVEQAFAQADDKGLVIVAAACNNGKWHGNGENVCYPGKFTSVIAVAAVDINNQRASFSSTGPEVELSAPGVSVYSTWNGLTSYSTPEPECHVEEGHETCYKYGSGTSMASPHVAGVAALMIASDMVDANGNGRINDEIRQILIETAVDLGDTGWDPWYGYGVINAVDAVAMSIPPEPFVDVAVSNILGPLSVIYGDDAVYEVIVANTGTEDVMLLDVALVDAAFGDEIGRTTIPLLESGASFSSFFTWDTVQSELGLHQLTAYHSVMDSNAANDSRSLFVTIMDDLPAELTITYLEPDQIYANTTEYISVHGSGFVAGAVVQFETGRGVVPVASVQSVSLDGTQIVVQVITKRAAKTTVWDVRVTNPDGISFVLENGLTVLP